MYYRIISGGETVDVCDGLTFVKYQTRNKMYLGCNSEEDATGIVSSDGSTIYLLSGAEQTGDLLYVTYTEITEEQYLSIRAQLVAAGTITAEDNGAGQEPAEDGLPETGTSGEEPEETDGDDTSLKIEAMQAQIDFLTECLLEMSVAVYG